MGNKQSIQNGPNTSEYVYGMVQTISSGKLFGNEYGYIPERRGVPNSSIPKNPNLTNLDSLLHDIYLRYVALNDVDFENYYGLVREIFLQMHKTMKQVDTYYNKYSSTVQFVGSHPDRLRINKPDEFDIDIAIDMPLSFKYHALDPARSDFLIEPSDPGFMQLKMGVQYQRLPKRDPSDWNINKQAYQWGDDENYLLISRFRNWFKSVVDRALNKFKGPFNSTPTFYVNGVPYTVRRSESGPAMTLYIVNSSRNIKLDIDLVVGLRFPIDRWPNDGNYRTVSNACQNKDYWMLVPKMNRDVRACGAPRSWRISMHEQERLLMHDTRNMRQAIRLMKKFRDAQYMTELASYYIKTLFFWEIQLQENNKQFWNNSPAFLFGYMMQKLYMSLITGYIPNFWHTDNNLLENIPKDTLYKYAIKVRNLIKVLEKPSQYKEVAKHLLYSHELEEYNEVLHLQKSLFSKIFQSICTIIKYLILYIIICMILKKISES